MWTKSVKQLPRAGAAILVALLAVLVYAASVRNGFVYDDAHAIVSNPAAHDPWAWRVIGGTRSWFGGEDPTIAYRPFTTWTFALDHALHGLEPRGYHVANVALHALVATLVVLVASTTGGAVAPALAAGALFAVHPIHTEAVANVVGRAELLVALCGLSALLLTRRDEWWAVIATLLLYGLALLAKENAVALLVLLPLARMSAERPHAQTRSLALGLGLFSVTVLYLGLRAAVLGTALGARESILRWQNPLAWTRVTERVLTALWIQVRAFWLLLVPENLSADYSYHQMPIIGSLADPRALGGIALAIGVAACAIWSWRRRSGRFYWTAFGLVAWLPVSNLLFPGGTIFAERLLYLPSVAFCVLLGSLLTEHASVWRRRAGAVMVAGLLGWWSLRTVERIPVWAEPLGFAETMARDAPESAHAQHFLGVTYAALGRDDDAMRAYAAALAIDPANVGSIYNIGLLHLRHGNLDDALGAFETATDVDPDYALAWVNQASIKNQNLDFPGALACADRAVALRPDLANGHVVRGVALRGLGRREAAQAAFTEAIRIAPDLAATLREHQLLENDATDR